MAEDEEILTACFEEAAQRSDIEALMKRVAELVEKMGTVREIKPDALQRD